MDEKLDEKQMRSAVIRWLNCLVHYCRDCDAQMVADLLGLRDAGELRSMAQRMIHELVERGQ